MEIAKRIHRQRNQEDLHFEHPALVYQYFEPLTIGLDVEKFWTLCLDRKNRLIKCVEVSSGTASSCLIHPRETFREAIRCSASTIIAVHNHPSGDPSPSAPDIKATRQLREAAKVIDIDLQDHVIIGSPKHAPYTKGYYSFAEGGLL